MKKKSIFITISILIFVYYLLPLALLKNTEVENLTKLGMFILLFSALVSFATNIIYAFLIKEKIIIIPILTIVMTIPYFFYFTSSFIITIITVIFSFLGYFLGNMIKSSK